MSIHSLNTQQIHFSQIPILVYGDVMLDRYWLGDTERISPEAPIPVVHVQKNRQCVGGAGNVALGVEALGATVYLFGLCGQDEAGEALEQLLTEKKVISHLHALADHPTTLKLRIMSHDQQLLRVDFEKKIATPQEPLINDVLQHLASAKALIISDYAKGVVGDVTQLIAASCLIFSITAVVEYPFTNVKNLTSPPFAVTALAPATSLPCQSLPLTKISGRI